MDGQQYSKADIARLRVTKVVLGVVLIGVVLIGPRGRIWPIISWPMYAGKVFGYPGDDRNEYAMTLTTSDGQVVNIDVFSLYPAGRYDATRVIMEGAMGSESAQTRERCRRALLSMVRRAMPGLDVAGVEVWQITWAVDVRAYRPLDYDAPVKKTRLLCIDAVTGNEVPLP